MTTYLEQELEQIKIKIFEMADLSIEAISRSVESLKNSDMNIARKVINDDSALDTLEMEVDDDCIKILVTKQPAATYFRLVLSILKINTDLERIGDLATSIAKETIRLGGKSPIKPLVDIPRMRDLAISMIKDSFASITERNKDLAIAVIKRDDEIDELNNQVYRELFTYMAENPGAISEAMSLLNASKSLERIGDHATNIAERAIYYIEGVDVRHDNFME